VSWVTGGLMVSVLGDRVSNGVFGVTGGLMVSVLGDRGV